LACIAAKYIQPIKRWNNSKISLGIMIAYLIVLFPMMHFINIKETKANTTLLQAMHLQNVNIDTAMEMYFESIEYNTLGRQEFRRRTAEYIDSLVLGQMGDPLQILNYVERIDEELIKQTKENPSDVTNYLLLMRHYNYTYVLNPQRLYEVAKIGEVALEYSPTRPQIYYELGYADLYIYHYLMDQEKIEEAAIYQQSAKDNFDKAIELNDDVVESYVNIIMVLLSSDQADKVQPYLDIMDNMELNYKTEQSLLRMSNSAIHVNEFAWAVIFFEIMVEVNPNNPDSYISLALSYANLDDNEKAIAIAEEVKKFGEPYITQSDEFIQSLKDGTFLKQE